MPHKVQSLLLNTMAAAVLAGVIVNIFVAQKNRELALENGKQQQFVQSTAPLDALNKEIVKAMVELSIKNQDEQLRALLSANGITFNFTPAAGAIDTKVKK